MYDYTPFTSEDLTTGISAVQDLSQFADVSQHFPTGKQVIFFTIGMLCVIVSLGLISRALLGDDVSLDKLAKLAPLAA